jgi:hypothetical protein
VASVAGGSGPDLHPRRQVRSPATRAPASSLILVLLRRIDGELPDELVVLIEDAHLRPSLHHDYQTASVGASDAEMEEEAAVAQADPARGVDLVVADPVALDEHSGLEGSSLGAALDGLRWPALPDGAVQAEVATPRSAGLDHYRIPSVT